MTSHLAALREFIAAHYTLEELRTLCLDLGVRYDDLGGEQRISVQARQLILFLGGKRRLGDLLAALQRANPAAFAQAGLRAGLDYVALLEKELASLEGQGAGPPAPIQQTAGDRAIQVAQNFGHIAVQLVSDRAAVLVAFIAIIPLAAIFFTWLAGGIGRADSRTPTPPAAPTSAETAPATEGSPLEPLRLVAFSRPALANSELRDVAAANGHTWFAATSGLFHYQAGAADAEQRLAEPVEVLAVGAAGSEVWFGPAGANAGKVGRYTWPEGRVEWFDPADSGLPPAGLVTALHRAAGSVLWVGDLMGNLYRLDTATGQWQLLPPPSALPVVAVYGLTAGLDDDQGVWLLGSSFLYQWQGDDWLPPWPADELASGVINGLAVDGWQRLWLGHAAGVTLFANSRDMDTRKECPIAGLPLDVVLDLAASEDGRGLWLVSRGGLAWLDVSAETMSVDCDDWSWQVWEEANFWQEDLATETYRLAVEEAAGPVWIIRQGTDKVRILQ